MTKLPVMPALGTREDMLAYAVEVEHLALALPKLTDEEIDALTDEEREEGAAIEQAHMSVVFARKGDLNHCLESIVVKFATQFPRPVVNIAKGKLMGLRKLASN